MKRYQPKDSDSTSLLRIARMHRGLSQRDLASESGIGQVTISHVESGRQMPHLSTQKLLSQALGYQLSDIFPPKGKRSTSKELRKLLERDLKQRRAER